jgi:DNA-binding CsgD family transcriptional regulator
MERGVAGELIGREEELREALAAFATLPALVALEGKAGIGKTSVWSAVCERLGADGAVVLTARPDEAETHLSYAGIADLLEPVLDDSLGELPAPQRQALEAALFRAEAEGRAPDQAAIAFAVLGTLRNAADDGRLIVAVDDLQWLDAPSRFALEFAVRRLRDESVGVLLAVRADRAGGLSLEFERWLPEERVRRIGLGPLSLGALHHVVQRRLGVTLPRPLLQRVYETSEGNPFFALELARALRQRGEQPKPGEPLPVSGELRQLLRARLCALSQEAQEALLVAASVSQPTVGLVARAVGEGARESLRHVVDAEVIELEDDRIRFVHPLFASAVSLEATAERRRAIHRRLAALVEDPEERAGHLALGTEGVDSAVASALDEAAQLARARGAPQAAAEFSERACRLTPQDDAEAVHRRRLEAGAAYFESGDTPRAQGLFTQAAEAARPGPERAAALSRLAWVHHYAGDQRIAAELFRKSHDEAGADPSVRADAADGLASSLFFLREHLPEALHHARFAARVAGDEADHGALAVALGTQGMIEAVLGHRDAAATLQSALALEDHVRDVPLVRRPSFQLAFARVWSDELEAARAALTGVREQAIAQGDESSLPFVLAYLSLAEFLSGRWQEALRAAAEGVDVALAAGQATGRAFALSTRALVASGLGREREARSDAREALALAERGTMFATATSLWGLGLLELSLDRPGEAHEQLGPLVARVEDADIGEPGSIRFVTDDVESLVTLGELDAAAAQLAHFEQHAQRLGRRSALAAVYRCRGLIASAAGWADEALAECNRALEEFEQLPLPFERARTLFALGLVQRQARQRRAARNSLERGLRLFEELGASLWAERARAELGRISGRAPSRGELTASERRVAELVAEGRTNREVAAALHVTPRTVEGALSRVYAKLGVRSRTELARRWASGS